MTPTSSGPRAQLALAADNLSAHDSFTSSRDDPSAKRQTPPITQTRGKVFSLERLTGGQKGKRQGTVDTVREAGTEVLEGSGKEADKGGPGSTDNRRRAEEDFDQGS